VCIGCRCALRPVAVIFCNSDFTIKIRVQSEKQLISANTVCYKIKVLKIYKESDLTRVALCSRRICTAKDSAACGRFFEKNKTYIVTGSIDKNNLRALTNSCTFGKNVEELEPIEKQFFKSGYKTQKCPRH